MKVVAVAPYAPAPEAHPDGLVDVYDITVAGTHLYAVAGVVVSNSKRISMLDSNALLAHGAMHNLQDIRSVRGQKNEQYWLQFMSGFTPAAPKVPFVYEAFVNKLKAAGVNVVRDGRQTNIMALTDKDIDALAGDRRVKTGDTVQFDHELAPLKDGLFDERNTGGHGGKSWSAVDLPEPMLNPVMEEPARRILGLTQKKFEAVLAGEEPLEGFGRGPKALAKALDKVDLDKEIDRARAMWHSGRTTARDEAVRKWGYLQSAKDLGIHPRDWVLTKAPVLPPVFRPISVMGETGVPLVSDPNYLYAELLHAIDNHKRMKEAVGEQNLGPERLALYHAFKAVTGLGNPVHPKLVEKNVKGLLAGLLGSSPKYSTFQRKLLSSTVDNVGRAVIVPEPNYDMDTVGIPENQAFDVYSRFVARRLKRRGLPLREALRHVKERTDLARDMLQEEMAARPVIINRAPVLHKFGILAFKPKLVKGDVVRMPPLVYKGFSCVGRVPIRENGIFRVVDLANFPHGAPIADEPDTYAVPDDIEVLTHVPGGFVWKHPDRYYVHRQLRGVKVTVGRARSAVVSEDQSLYCFDPQQGKCRRMRPGEALGALTPRPLACTVAAETHVATVVGPDGEPLALTEELGWWLGATIGDGWVSTSQRNPKGVCFSGKKASSAVMRAWVESTKNLFGRTPGKAVRRKAGCTQAWGQSSKVTVNATELANWLLPLIGHRAKNKHLPRFLWRAPEAFRLGVIAGLLDTDGHLKFADQNGGRLNVTLTTKSRRLAEEFTWLLADHGVDALHAKRTNNHGRKAWVVYPSVLSLSTLAISLRQSQKRLHFERLSQAPKNGRNCDNRIPITPEEAAQVLKAYVGTPATAKRNKDLKAYTEYSCLRASLRSGTLQRVSLAAIIARLGRAGVPGALLARYDGDERWEPITKIEPDVIQDMYDLRVPGESYTFVLVNKLTVFDSADNDGDAVQFHVPTTDAAVNEAYERLLPSRSLLSPADFKSPVHAPSQEYLAGLYESTRHPYSPRRPRYFRNKDDALDAYRRGTVNVDDSVVILE